MKNEIQASGIKNLASISNSQIGVPDQSAILVAINDHSNLLSELEDVLVELVNKLGPVKTDLARLQPDVDNKIYGTSQLVSIIQLDSGRLSATIANCRHLIQELEI